jgi:hypothetical protein
MAVQPWWSRVAGLLVVWTILAFVGLSLSGASSTARAAPEDQVFLTVLHGLPGFTADVYVNGKLTLDGFKPEEVTDPLALPAGRYTLAIRDVGAAPTSKPVLEATVNLVGGTSYTVAAHLSETGAPALRLFTNDLSTVPAGKGRFVVRDLADAPTLNVALNGKTKFRGLTDPDEGQVTLKAGMYSVEARDASSSEVLVKATPFSIKAGTAEFVYVIGSAQDNTLDFMAQSALPLGGSPSSVFAGSAGLAADPGVPVWLRMSVWLGAAATALSALWLLLDRRRRAAAPHPGQPWVVRTRFQRTR